MKDIIGNSYEFTIIAENPLEDLYEKLALTKRITKEEIRLIYKLNTLIKHRTAQFYNITEDSLIMMCLMKPFYFVEVKLPNDGLKKIKINAHLKISSLKEKIIKELNIVENFTLSVSHKDGIKELDEEKYVGEISELAASSVEENNNYIVLNFEKKENQ